MTERNQDREIYTQNIDLSEVYKRSMDSFSPPAPTPVESPVSPTMDAGPSTSDSVQASPPSDYEE